MIIDFNTLTDDYKNNFIGFKINDMPLTKKGKKIKKAMERTYGKKKGERVFYATENKRKLKGLIKK